VNTIRIWLGHESLDVTLAYLKGKDAESEEVQEHASSSSLTCTHERLLELRLLAGGTLAKG